MSFLIVSIIWFFSEIFLAKFAKSNETSNRKDKKSLLILWITIITSIFIGIIVKISQKGDIFDANGYIHYLGISLIIIGLIIRWVAIIKLGKFFTVDVSVHKDQKLITTGLYKYVRHPSYLGSLMSFFGLGIALTNYFSVAIITILTTSAFAYRIVIEEKVLIELFGTEYEEYKKHTKRIIPGVF